MRKEKKKRSISNILLVIIFLVGLSVMLYPVISDWWNSRTQGKVVANYQKAVSDLNKTDEEAILERARKYNRALASLYNPIVDYEQIPDYDDILDITGTGVMGVINIPAIGVELPIYHGTSEGVLNIAVGHLQGSSLPVGGRGTHAVISAHRGLPSAKLFTDLDKLIVGDEFTVTVLSTVYTYEVDNIFIVLPSETQNLAIDPGKEQLTLMTCTPYGINTHRLLVRSHRIGTAAAASEEQDKPEVKVLPDAVMVDSLSVVPFVAALPVALLLGWWIFGGRKKRHLPEDLRLEENSDNKDNGQDDPKDTPKPEEQASSEEE
ncbi:MAG: class C sortase [Ruminococcus sp.]|nr:class C sortase [Ruminococcus sp.]